MGAKTALIFIRSSDTHKSTHHASGWRQRQGAAVTMVNTIILY